MSYCNLDCVFCAYRLDLRPRTVMTTTRFIDVVDQAAEMGFRAVVLTPMLGDVFVDRDFIAKLDYLEGKDGIEAVAFYTNLIGAGPQALARIATMEKLAQVVVSLYGHDAESFRDFTGAGDAQYRRLVANVETLADSLDSRHGKRLAINICTRRGFVFPGAPPSDLCRAVERLVARTGAALFFRHDYDNWGGLIDHPAVAGLDITVIDGARLWKKGPCQLVFGYVQVMADGRVNACACRDVRGDLVIGDLAERPLAEILSPRNPAYMDLIESQEAGRFPASCRSCSFYQSIYDDRIGPQPFGLPMVTRQDFFRLIGRA